MYIVTIGHTKGKKYLYITNNSLAGVQWTWKHTFKDATRFKTYIEAKDAMRLVVHHDQISDATIYGYM